MKLKTSKPSGSSKKKDVKCLSVDIGSSMIKFAVGQRTGKRIRIEKTFIARLSNGVYENGHIQNIPDLKLAIERAISDNDVKVKDVIVTIESTDVIKREITLPAVDDADLADMVSYEISQYLPIDINSYSLQYKIVKEFQEDNVKKYELLVAALPKELTFNLHSLFTDLGLSPLALDIHSNAIDKIIAECEYVNGVHSIPENTVAFLDLGHQNINVIISEKGEYKFNRIIKQGTVDFAQLTNKYEFSDMSEITPYMDVVDRWTREIDKVFKYYTTRSVDNTIDKIFIYGGISLVRGLSSYIQEKFNISTEVVSSLDNVEIVNGNENSIAQSLNAISAIIRL